MKRALIVFGGVAALLVLALYSWPGPKPVAHVYFEAAPVGRAEIIAHGGGQGHAPPNTLLALQRASEKGADVLEIDVQQTRDGVLIVRHDDTLDRTTDLQGLIADLDWADIAKADAGATWIIENERFADRGISVPKLEDALATFPDARWILEIKNDTPAAAISMCAAIRSADALDRVLVASFHDDAMAQFRAVCPSVATSMSSGEVQTFVIAARVGLARRVSTPAVALQIPMQASGLDLTHPRVIAAAKARGIRVQYWTINTPDDISYLLEAGADGIMTDYVDRGFAALEMMPE